MMKLNAKKMEERPFKKGIDDLRSKHQSNKEKGVYGYMGWSDLKIILIYAVTIIPIVLVLKRYVDLNTVFTFITENFSDYSIIIIFFASESFLGMIPPDIFVIWSAKFDAPFLLLLMFGVLSYSGGIVSYYIGYGLSHTKKISRFSERALKKYIHLVRKWGGAFIIIAALFPYTPFSMIIIAMSLLRYPLKLYLVFGIARIARFLIQGLFYLELMDLDRFIDTIFH
jgi:membrane protein YqaA with SNARE-associated domain